MRWGRWGAHKKSELSLCRKKHLATLQEKDWPAFQTRNYDELSGA